MSDQDFLAHVVSPYDLELDGTKVWWWQDRIAAWKRGERIAPVTMDVAWTRKCQASCNFCYATLQSSEGGEITREIAFKFLDDCAEIGVKGVSLISDGESTMVPFFADSVEYGAKLGLQMGTSSNGINLTPKVLEQILPHLSYLRFNFSGGDKHRWAQIMGLKQPLYDRVVANVKSAMEIKRRDSLPVTINLQLVSMPQDADQLLPFARLCAKLRPDFGIIKHCADSRDGELGVDYTKYKDQFDVMRECEALSDDTFRMAVKWSRLADEGKRSYKRCYGPNFILQMSGNGLISPCGQLFNGRYSKMHIGNITRNRWRDIWMSDRYMEVMGWLASDSWDSQTMCGPNCLQHNSNIFLDKLVKGERQLPDISQMKEPVHAGFL